MQILMYRAGIKIERDVFHDGRVNPAQGTDAGHTLIEMIQKDNHPGNTEDRHAIQQGWDIRLFWFRNYLVETKNTVEKRHPETGFYPDIITFFRGDYSSKNKVIRILREAVIRFASAFVAIPETPV
jgi:hypothetical protein